MHVPRHIDNKLCTYQNKGQVVGCHVPDKIDVTKVYRHDDMIRSRAGLLPL